MEKTLYITDLDGTLLNKDSKVTEYTANIINELIEDGMNFSIATARSWVSASKIVNKLNLKFPVTTYNGGFIVEPKTGEIIISSCFDNSGKKHAFDILINAGVFPIVYAFIDGKEKLSWLSGIENDGMKAYIESRRGDTRLREVYSLEELIEGDVFYFSAIGTKEQLEPLQPLFYDETIYSYTFQQELYRNEYWLEIKRFDATKAIGIEKLKNITGCTRIISFGDSTNDLPMFSISDEAYAVADAKPILKKAATNVIGSCDNDGVANWLKENFK